MLRQKKHTEWVDPSRLRSGYAIQVYKMYDNMAVVLAVACILIIACGRIVDEEVQTEGMNWPQLPVTVGDRYIRRRPLGSAATTHNKIIL